MGSHSMWEVIRFFAKSLASSGSGFAYHSGLSVGHPVLTCYMEANL